MNPNHSTILAEYKLNIKKDPGAILEPQFNFYREQTDHRKKQNKEYVRYFNPEINDQAKLLTKKLANYVQMANGGITVTYFKAKFIEQINISKKSDFERPKLVFIGIESSGLFFDSTGTALEDVYVVGQHFQTAHDDYKDGADYVFSPDIIQHLREQPKALKIQAHSGCAGSFCNYLEKNGLSKVSTHALSHLEFGVKARKEMDKQSLIVPQKNHLGINSVSTIILLLFNLA